MTEKPYQPQPLVTGSARVLTGLLGEHRELQTRLAEQPGLLVVGAAPWSGTSALVSMTLDDLTLATVRVDARVSTGAGDLARRIAGEAVAALAPAAIAWWTGRASANDVAGLQLRRTLDTHGVDAERLRDGAADPARLLTDAVTAAVALAEQPVVVAIDHLDRLLDALDGTAARVLLDGLRAARQRLPALQLLLIGRLDGPLARARRDAGHPLYRAGDELVIARAHPQRFVDDLGIVRPWTRVSAELLGAAAELAAGVPFLTWQTVELAPPDGESDRDRALSGWQRLRGITEAQTAQTFDLIRAAHPLAAEVVIAIARTGRPYGIDANSNLVGDALARLRELGPAWQPRPRSWALTSPLLIAWLREATRRGRRPNVHTVKVADGWANILEGLDRILDIAPTKAAAEKAGRERARRDRVEHVIHRRDGTISERNSYGRDPARTLVHDS